MRKKYFTPHFLLYCAPLDEFLRVIFVHFGALSRGRGTGVNPKVVTSVQAYLMTAFVFTKEFLYPTMGGLLED